MNNGLLRTKLHITHKGNPIAFFSVFQHNIETSLAVCPQVWKERQEMMMILASLETFANLSFLSTFQLVSYMIICFRSGDGEWGSGAFACCFSVPVERLLPTPHPHPGCISLVAFAMHVCHYWLYCVSLPILKPFCCTGYDYEVFVWFTVFLSSTLSCPLSNYALGVRGGHL